MSRSLCVLLLALIRLPELSGQDAAAPPTPRSPFRPDTVVVSDTGVRVVLLGGPDPAVAALRLSVPFVERPDEAGIGRVLQDMALDRLQTLARPFGVQVDVVRTPWGLAYSAAGAAADFETLAWLLREASARPETGGAAFARARAGLREAAARGEETPLGKVSRELRARVAPEATPETPSAAGADALDGAAVLRAWQRTHQGSAMTLVIAATVSVEVVLASVHDLGAPARVEIVASDPPPSARPATVQTLRVWHGEAFAAGTADDPLARIAALLVARQLERTTGPWETSVQLWTLPGRSVLVLLGAAYPRNAPAMRDAVGSALAATAAALDDGEVRSATARLRRDILLGARTPSGLVATVGRAYESGEAPEDIDARLRTLGELDAAALRTFLSELSARGPVRAEVRP